MKKGELLMLSTEEYSDQCHAGPFMVLIDFNISDIAEIVKDEPSINKYRIKAGPDDVIHYLKNKGFIVEVPCKSIHLGSYGDICLYGALE